MSTSLLNASGYPVLKAEWLVTRACQLFCSYCEIAHKKIPELSIEDKCKIADKLKDFNVFPVLYGGEVTISRDFEKLLAYMKEIDLQYAVISNGMVNLQTLEKWATKLGLQNWSVSIDTLNFNPRPGFSDEEVLRKARAGYATLVFTEGLVRDRVTCTTVVKQNIHEIPEIVRRMSSMGVYTILSMVNQYKPGFRYSAPGANDMVPSQKEVDELVDILTAMSKQSIDQIELRVVYRHLDGRFNITISNGAYNFQIPYELSDYEFGAKMQELAALHKLQLKTNVSVDDSGSSYTAYELVSTKPAFLFHDPPEVWEMWRKHAVKADWHCSRFTKFTIDSDGFLQCCVDWKGKNFGKTSMLDLTRENFSEIEKSFLEDIWDCQGCAWSPIKLLETEQEKGELGHEMIRHNLPPKQLQGIFWEKQA